MDAVAIERREHCARVRRGAVVEGERHRVVRREPKKRYDLPLATHPVAWKRSSRQAADPRVGACRGRGRRGQAAVPRHTVPTENSAAPAAPTRSRCRERTVSWRWLSRVMVAGTNPASARQG